MFVDLKEQQRLVQFEREFYTEVKQSVLNVIYENSDCTDVEMRKKITAIIEKYFDESIGIEKMRTMLLSRGCISDPAIILEKIKANYLNHYETSRLPRVNSQVTLNKIANVEKEVEKKIDKILGNEPRRLGFCHLYWATKKKILHDEYGIIWYTPAECNPEVIYD